MNNKRVVKFCKEFYFVNKPHLSPRHARYSNKQVTILYPKRTIFFFLVLFSVKLNTSMFYKRQKDHIISCRLSRAVANQAQLSKLNLFNVSLFQRSANKLRQIWPFTWLLNSILKKIAPSAKGSRRPASLKIDFLFERANTFLYGWFKLFINPLSPLAYLPIGDISSLHLLNKLRKFNYGRYFNPICIVSISIYLFVMFQQ